VRRSMNVRNVSKKRRQKRKSIKPVIVPGNDPGLFCYLTERDERNPSHQKVKEKRPSSRELPTETSVANTGGNNKSSLEKHKKIIKRTRDRSNQAKISRDVTYGHSEAYKTKLLERMRPGENSATN